MLQMFSNMALKKGWVFFVMVFTMLFEPAENVPLPAHSVESPVQNRSLVSEVGKNKNNIQLIENRGAAKPSAEPAKISVAPSPPKLTGETAKTGEKGTSASKEGESRPETSPTLQQKTKRQWIEENKKKPLLHRDLSKLKSVEVTATGYYAGVESTGKTKGHPQYGITYSGVRVRRDVFSTIAADLKVFPLGTILYIPGYGYGIVADIGSKVKGNKIDLYFETKEQVYKEWGKRKVNVYVVKRGNGKVTESMLDNLNSLFAESKEAKAL